MVRPFLPEIPEAERREGRTITEYLLGPKGHKAFQKLMEDISPYSIIPQNLD
jgi:hypothetical protein